MNIGAATNNGTIAPGTGIGALTLTDNVDFLDVTGVGSSSSWIIATYGGALTGVFDNVTRGFTVDYGTSSNGQITLMVAALPGDWNYDGKVDAADYVTWRNDPANNGGDPDGYNIWRQNFGNSSGSGSDATSAGSAVPEPATLLLIFLANATHHIRGRRELSKAPTMGRNICPTS